MLEDNGIVNQKIRQFMEKIKCEGNRLFIFLLLSLLHSLVILLISYILFLCHVPAAQVHKIDCILDVDHNLYN